MDENTNEEISSRSVPLKWLIVLIVLCIIPSAIAFLGGNQLLQGSGTYLVLSSISFSIAFFIAILTLIQFSRTGEVSTPVLGLGMLCAGAMDLWQAIAVASNPDISEQYVLLSWTFSRLYFAVILLFSATVSPMFEKVKGNEQKKKARRLATTCGVFFLLIAGIFMALFSFNSELVARIFSGGVLEKILIYAPIVLLIIAATYVLPTFNMWHRNIFSTILIIACVPLIIAQLHFAFGVGSIYDTQFGAANLLKIVGYLIPLIGLVLDYEHTYATTEESITNLRKKLFELEQGRGASSQHDSFYNTLMSNLKTPVVFTDTSGKVTRINDHTAQLAAMGLGSKALPLLAIGRDLTHVLGEEMGPVAQNALERVLSTNKEVQLEPEKFTYKDGKQYNFSWAFHPIYNADKVIVAVVSIARPVQD